ncbi:fimbria/pilus periplasmic chaperone [bacterium]|nr:fimbria/pilus periplasmic chaperone [bacterium]
MKCPISLLLLLSVLMAHDLGAGDFKVNPTKLHLNENTSTTILNLSNNHQEPVTVQLEIVEWKQNEMGEDTYSPTKDIVFFPKIFTLDPDREMIVRIGYQGDFLRERERAFRLFVQELPITKPGETAIKMTLTLSIPLFVGKSQVQREGAIEGVGLKDGTLGIHVKNTGNHHLQIQKIDVIGLDESGARVFSTDASGSYVLANASKTIEIRLPETECRSAKNVSVLLSSEDLKLEASTQIQQQFCERGH